MGHLEFTASSTDILGGSRLSTASVVITRAGGDASGAAQFAARRCRTVTVSVGLVSMLLRVRPCWPRHDRSITLAFLARAPSTSPCSSRKPPIHFVRGSFVERQVIRVETALLASATW